MLTTTRRRALTALTATAVTAPGLATAGLAGFGTIAGRPRRAQAALGRDTVGLVDRARGTAEARFDDATRALIEASDILFRDLVVTRDSTRLQIAFRDDSTLFVGDGSEVRIDHFVFDPTSGIGEAGLQVTEGVFRFISGQITKQPRSNVQLATPSATIGIRGTDFWGFQTGDRLDLVLLDDGVVTVRTAGGVQVLSEPNTGLTVTSLAEPPGPPTPLDPDVIAAALETVAF